MSIDTLYRLQDQYNREPMQQVNQLADTLGNILQQRGQRSFEQDAINFFSDGDLSTQKLQEFQQMYPNAPAMEVWKVASAVGTQAKAQRMKDALGSLRSIYLERGKENKYPSQQDIQSVLGILKQEDLPDAMKIANDMKSHWGEEVKSYKHGNMYLSTSPDGSTKDVTPAGLNPPKEIKKELKGIDPTSKKPVYESDGQLYLSDGTTFTGGQILPINSAPPQHKVLTEIPDPTGKTATKAFVDPNNNSVTNIGKPFNVKSQVPNVNVHTGGDAEKPRRVPYRDTVTGAINYYDVNNAQDRAVLQKYGGQLQSIAENPVTAAIRQGMNGQPSTSPPAPAQTKYKSADEVKAAYQSGKLTQGQAAGILRNQFGFK